MSLICTLKLLDCVLISYFGSVYMQEFFLKGELLAGIFFFFCNFSLQEFFLGNCHPPSCDF